MTALLTERHHQVIIEPLMQARFMPEAIEDLEGIAAIVATSRNGIRALAQSRHAETATGLTVFAVGAGTADEALRLGCQHVLPGPGTASGLAGRIAGTLDPSSGMILLLVGDVVAGDVAGALEQYGYRVETALVYRMEAAGELSESTRDAIADGTIDAVLLMSPRTAAIYVRLMTRHRLGYGAAQIMHLCLSDAVAGALAPLGRVPIAVADTPSLAAMMALVERATE